MRQRYPCSKALGTFEPLDVVEVGYVLEVHMSKGGLQGHVGKGRVLWVPPYARGVGLGH